jgi:hypothetical protein
LASLALTTGNLGLSWSRSWVDPGDLAAVGRSCTHVPEGDAREKAATKNGSRKGEASST